MLQEDDKMKIGYRKKWKDDAVSPVIATILMVAITVVLAAVLYVMVTYLITPPPPNIDTTLAAPEALPDSKYSIMVMAANHQMDLREFTAKLYEDGIEVGTLDPIGDNSSDGKILGFSDRDGQGTLSGGDVFVVQTESDHRYELVLFYGSDLSGERKWNT